MTPRERVLAFLRREIPDRVPWSETGIDLNLQARIMGSRDFKPAELSRRLGLDSLAPRFSRESAPPPSARDADTSLGAYYYPRTITFDFNPPWIAEMGLSAETGRNYIKKGLLTSRESLALFDQFLPDPDHPARYERVARWIDEYSEDYAVFARLRLGTAPTLESMGVDAFSYMLYDDPGLIYEIHSRFSEWTIRVLHHLNEMDFDFYWFADDVAANQGPFMSPRAFEERILPHMQRVAKEIQRPWLFHSDGDLSPILPDLVSLGMNGIHPFQPSVMDIRKAKEQYGDVIGIIGNIDLDHTLTLGTPEEVDTEVRERISALAPGGGFMISSANSLPDYCRTENVLAMAEAIEKYGYYPIGTY